MSKIICKKDKVEARKIVFPTYEYMPGVPLHNVKAYECPICNEFIFTSQQVDRIEKHHMAEAI
ncbi:MAG: hypothetical protein AABX01_03010 [Candidatus Micrarchaeota archaeon]